MISAYEKNKLKKLRIDAWLGWKNNNHNITMHVDKEDNLGTWINDLLRAILRRSMLGCPHIGHMAEILGGHCSLPEGARHCDKRPSDATPPFINAFSIHRQGLCFRRYTRWRQVTTTNKSNLYLEGMRNRGRWLIKNK